MTVIYKDSVHFFIPTKEVTNTYSLDETEHKYFVNSEYSEIFAPNEINIKNPNNEGVVYTGKAKDLVSYEAIPSSRTEYISGLTSNAQAILVANAILQNLKSYHNGYSAKVPMQFGQELYDRPQLISRRTGKTYMGNSGTIERVYTPRKSEPQYYMNIQCGKWFDPRAAWDIMGVGAGFVDTSEENKYTSIFTSCFAYNATSGTWTPGYYVYDAVGAASDGNWIKYKVKVPSGSYKLRFGYFKAPSCGIMKVYIDTVLALTLDQYVVDVGGLPGSTDEEITIADSTSDWHEFKFITDGKNGSSSGYNVTLTGFVLYPF